MNIVNQRHSKKKILHNIFVEKMIIKDSSRTQNYPISAWLALTQGHQRISLQDTCW